MLLTESAAKHILLVSQRKKEIGARSTVLSHTTGTLAGDQVLGILNANVLLGKLSHAPVTAHQYNVTVRNLRTNEQYMHPKPLSQLTDWYALFIDRPIFRNINFANKHTLPQLAVPAHEAFSIQRFQLDGEWFSVTTSKAGGTPPSTEADTVQVYLVSPSLPKDHTCFSNIAGHSSQLRRAYAAHIAVGELAKTQGLALMESPASGASGGGVDADDDGDLAYMHGDNLKHTITNSAPLRFAGAFSTSRVEHNTGADVLPLVIQHLRFLLLLLDTRQPVIYDILQPHRYGYVFQLRSLSGWRVLGAVNLFAELNELTSLLPTPEPDELAVRNLPPLPFANASVYEQLQTAINSALRTVNAEFDGSVPSWAAHNKAAAEPWFTSTKKPNIRAQSSELQKRALPSHLWSPIIAFMGLRFLLTSIAQSARSVSQHSHIERGERFRKAWLASVTGEDHHSHSHHPLSGLDLAIVLYEMASTLASLTLIQYTNSSDATLTSRALRDQLTRGTAKVVPVDITNLTAAVRTLQNTPTSKCIIQLMQSLPLDAMDFTHALLHDRAMYAGLITPLTNTIPVTQDAAFFKNAKAFSTTIYRAYVGAKHCCENNLRLDTPENKKIVISALAYAIFTANAEHGVNQWS
jgi:hypothetical protein